MGLCPGEEGIDPAYDRALESRDPGSPKRWNLTSQDIEKIRTIGGLEHELVSSETTDQSGIYNEPDLALPYSPAADTPKIFTRKKDLQILPDYIIRSIFFGIPNIRIPAQMLDATTGVELLSIWNYTGYTKRKSATSASIVNEPSRDFSDLVKTMNRFSFGSPEFREMRNHARVRYPSNPLDQVRRYAGLDEQVKSVFIDSFFSPYLPSYYESRTEGRYGDPGTPRLRLQRVWENIKHINERYK
jgi:hypothetical protein